MRVRALHRETHDWRLPPAAAVLPGWRPRAQPCRVARNRHGVPCRARLPPGPHLCGGRRGVPLSAQRAVSASGTQPPLLGYPRCTPARTRPQRIAPAALRPAPLPSCALPPAGACACALAASALAPLAAVIRRMQERASSSQACQPRSRSSPPSHRAAPRCEGDAGQARTPSRPAPGRAHHSAAVQLCAAGPARAAPHQACGCAVGQPVQHASEAQTWRQQRIKVRPCGAAEGPLLVRRRCDRPLRRRRRSAWPGARP
jgi:hypothetical protein